MSLNNLNDYKPVNSVNGHDHEPEATKSKSNDNTAADPDLVGLTLNNQDADAVLEEEDADAVLEELLEPFTKTSGLFKLWGGPYQFLIFLTAISALATDGINLLLFLFVNAPVDYHCAQMNSNSDIFNGSLISKCTVDQEYNTNSTVNTPCTKWNYDTSEYSSTITTEFNLVCSQSWLSHAFQLCYIIGTLGGDLLGGTISDRFGRKTSLRLGVAASLLCTFTIGFSPYLPLILIARVMQGIAYTVMFGPSNTLMMETLLPKSRSFSGMCLDIFYAFAIMSLSGLAYLIRDWRVLVYSTSFFIVGLIPLALVVDESIRWLIQQGRLEEAQQAIEKIAKWNDKLAEYKEQEADIGEKLQVIKSHIDTGASDEPLIVWLKSGIQQLYGHPVMRKISIMAPLFMFLMSTLYNGIPFNANNFEGSTYWYMFGIGIMEMASAISGVVVVKWCTRVFMAQLTVGFAALCVLLTTFIPESLSYLSGLLSMAAMWSTAITYNMEYLWIDEIYPTSVRQRGGAIVHFTAHLSGFAALFITGVMESWAWWLPTVMLSICGIVDIYVATLLPETKDLVMCNTVDDVVRRRDESRKGRRQGEKMKANTAI